MHKLFPLKILAAEKPFFEGNCASLLIPETDGLRGIMADHENLIAALVPGELRYQTESGEWYYAAISEGIMKVENGEVLILADAVERPEEIDTLRAQREADQARETLLQKRSIQNYHIATGQMARALNRLRVKKRYGSVTVRHPRV